ncbi:MAG: CBS domain-containing protein [Verrucomicrobiota bacterium]
MIHEQIEPDRIIELAAANRWKEIEEQFKERHPADLAAVISDAPKMFRNHLFAIITEDLKPDVLAELEGFAEDEVLESLSNAEISEIVEDMDPDDAADVIAELPPDRSEKILDLMEDEESEEVRELLKYDEESAGGIMTPDVIALQADLTVEEAFARIAESDIDEPFFYAYIVDQNQTLMSFVGLWKLVRIKDRSRTLSDVATKDVISATADMDQEDVAKMMQKYNLTAIPVVDDQHRLVGRITADDVIDVL